jgi:hypothetical protein
MWVDVGVVVGVGVGVGVGGCGCGCGCVGVGVRVGVGVGVSVGEPHSPGFMDAHLGATTKSSSRKPPRLRAKSRTSPTTGVVMQEEATSTVS